MKDITNSEAIFYFVEWLNSRFDQTTFSLHNRPEPGLELAKRFCEANNWTIPKNFAKHENQDVDFPPLD